MNTYERKHIASMGTYKPETPYIDPLSGLKITLKDGNFVIHQPPLNFKTEEQLKHFRKIMGGVQWTEEELSAIIKQGPGKLTYVPETDHETVKELYKINKISTT